MEDKRLNKTKVQIIFSTLIFTIAFFVEIYVIVNYKEMFGLIAGVVILALLALAFLVSGMIELNAINNKQRSDQYENLYRSDKASYLVSKKGFEDIMRRLDRVEKVALIPTEEIVSAQKGIAKVIINRNRENAEAIMNSNDLLNERFDSFEMKLKSNNREQIDEAKAVNSENLQQFLEKQQEVIINLKDMEIRLNTSIMQAQKMLAEQKALLNRPQQIIQQPYIQQASPVQSVLSPSSTLENIDLSSATEEPENIDIPDVEEVPEVMTEPEAGLSLDIETPVSDEGLSLEGIEPEVTPDMEIPALDEGLNLEGMEPEVTPDMEIPVLDEGLSLEGMEPENIDIPSPEEEPEPEVSEAPATDFSDPNAKMSPDDIAALLASMTQDAKPAPAPAPEPEPAPAEPEIMQEAEAEPAEPETIQEAEAAEPEIMQEAEPVPALDVEVPATEEVSEAASEEISETEEEPLLEILDTDVSDIDGPILPMPDLSDPNAKMSPDDIAALFANLGDVTADSAGNKSATEISPEISEDLVPDDILNEVSADIASAPEEEKPPMPDLSDPNKKMSPDEIAALFANM